MATLTFAYRDSTAVVGPLSGSPVPGAFDLCSLHAERTSVPRGWEVIRLPLDATPEPAVDDDDLLALAEAVRAIGWRHDEPEPELEILPPAEAVRQLGHLRLLPGLG